ncbi:hypothetical protein LLE49_19885 [Alicyclobacillus tolerans]|uniref:hypothetical protein n=1 Tax=Alicyclobacillus tolerans TaxID=90970 RepID=UPI001F2FF031|nr:hypothetical protein [Alicyclobacillus tolerans]MCF8566985.1 hypothetical protein [Alicyclobacillus tolerans]
MNKLQIRKSHKKWLYITVGTGVLVGIVVIGMSFNGVQKTLNSDLKQSVKTSGVTQNISMNSSSPATNNTYEGKYKIVTPITETSLGKKTNQTQKKTIKTQNHSVTTSPVKPVTSKVTSVTPFQSLQPTKPSPSTTNQGSFHGSACWVTETVGSISKTFYGTTCAQADQAGQAWANKEQQIVDEQAKQAQDQANAKYAQQDCQQIEQEQADAKASGMAYQGPSCAQVYQDYGLPYPYPGN